MQQHEIGNVSVLAEGDSRPFRATTVRHVSRSVKFPLQISSISALPVLAAQVARNNLSQSRSRFFTRPEILPS